LLAKQFDKEIYLHSYDWILVDGNFSANYQLILNKLSEKTEGKTQSKQI
tara:strand:+ start:571 stop:717 length:147 start_codon:yes stop_codon:yes gene_type:complete